MNYQQIQPDSLIYGKQGSYIIIKHLGSGTGGQVFLGKDQQTHQNVAIKIQKIMNSDEQKISSLFASKKFKHITNVIEFYFNPQRQNYIIIMDYCNGGNLAQFMNQYQLQYEHIYSVIAQIAEGLQELHNFNFIHRDIKPENILVFREPQNSFCIKLCDFGLVKSESLAQTLQIGTIYYMAPELCNQQCRYDSSQDNSIDIWALGCIWYELITKKILFNGNSRSEITSKIMNNDQQWINQQIDILQYQNKPINPRDKQLMKNMICKDKQMRFSASQILQTMNGADKWLKQVQPKSQMSPDLEMHKVKFEQFQFEQVQKLKTQVEKKSNQYQLELEKFKKQSSEILIQLNSIQLDDLSLNNENQSHFNLSLTQQVNLLENQIQFIEEKQNILNEINQACQQRRKLLQLVQKINEKNKFSQEIQQLSCQLKESPHLLNDMEQEKVKQLLKQYKQEEQHMIIRQQQIEFQDKLKQICQEKFRELLTQFDQIQVFRTNNQIEIINQNNNQMTQEIFNENKSENDHNEENIEEFEQTQQDKKVEFDKIKLQYETNLQEFKINQHLVLGKISQLQTIYHQIELNYNQDSKQIQNTNQYQEYIMEINQKQDQLKLINLACEQRKDYFNLEEQLNQNNKQFHALQCEINNLKSSLDILSEEQLDKIGQIKKSYQQEQQFIDEELSIQQERDALHERLRKENLARIEQLEKIIEEKRETINQKLNQFQHVNETVLNKMLKDKEIKQFIVVPQQQEYKNLEDQVHDLELQLETINQNLKTIDLYNQACLQRKPYLDLENQFYQLDSSKKLQEKIGELIEHLNNELIQVDVQNVIQENLNDQNIDYYEIQLKKVEDQISILKNKTLNIDEEQIKVFQQEYNTIQQEYKTIISQQKQRIQQLQEKINLKQNLCQNEQVYVEEQVKVSNQAQVDQQDQLIFSQKLKEQIIEYNELSKLILNIEKRNLDQEIYIEKEKEQKQYQEQQDQIKHAENLNNKKQLFKECEQLKFVIYEKKKQYDLELQEFNQNYEIVLNKFKKCPNLEQLNLNPINLKGKNLDQQFNQLNQYSLAIDQQQEKLKQFHQVCQQIKYYFDFEDRIDRKNKYCTIIKEQINKLKDSFEYIPELLLEDINNSIKLYTNEDSKNQKKLAYFGEIEKYISLINTLNQLLSDQKIKQLIEFDSQQYKQLEKYNIDFIQIQKINQFYQLELNEYQNQYNLFQQGQHFHNIEEELIEFEQAEKEIKQKQFQIEKDREIIQQINQGYQNILKEYQFSIEWCQKEIVRQNENLLQKYQQRQQQYLKLQEQLKKRLYSKIYKIDETFKILFQNLLQEQNQLNQWQECKFQQWSQNLVDSIMEYHKLSRILAIQLTKIREFESFKIEIFEKELSENLTFEPTRRQEYQMNQVKLRGKLKNQTLIQKILRLQDRREEGYQQKILKVLQETYDKIMFQFNEDIGK